MAARRATVLGLLLLLPLLPSASSSSMVFKLDGNVYPDGHFYVTVNIGEKEKEKPYFLDIDTGSNLSWLECDAGQGTCETCNKVPHPLYQVISKKLVPCAHSLCNVVHGDLGTNKNCRYGPDQCGYDIRKFDGSRTLGVLLVDKFSFPMGHGSSARSDIAFGCGYNQVKKGNQRKVAVDGMLGLGRGSVDLVSQLKRQGLITKNVISHCLSTTGGGYLVLGEHEVPLTRITWVPMAPKIPGKSNHYSPGEATLQLDTKLVDTKPVQVVFDSGSTYTYLPPRLHALLVSAMGPSLNKSLKLVKDDPALSLCWKRPGGFKSMDHLKKEFKSVMSLKFGTGATMMIPPENYLVINEKGNACLGMLGMKNLDMIIVGDIMFQGQLVTYDNEKGVLGWMRSQCHTSRPVDVIQHQSLALPVGSQPSAGGGPRCNSAILASQLVINCKGNAGIAAGSCCKVVKRTIDDAGRQCLCTVAEDGNFAVSPLSVRRMWELYKTCGGRQEQAKNSHSCDHTRTRRRHRLPRHHRPPSPPSGSKQPSPLEVAVIAASVAVTVCAAVSTAILTYLASPPAAAVEAPAPVDMAAPATTCAPPAVDVASPAPVDMAAPVATCASPAVDAASPAATSALPTVDAAAPAATTCAPPPVDKAAPPGTTSAPPAVVSTSPPAFFLVVLRALICKKDSS